MALASAGEIDAAVRAARSALPKWAATTPLRRARVMFKLKELLEQHIDELAGLISAEHGKTLDDAKGEVTRGIEVVEFACGIPQLLKGEFSENVGTGVDQLSFRQPLGVCAGITPFNFPAMIPLVDVADGDRLRQHLHPQALGEGPVLPAADRRAAKEAGCPPACSTSSTATRPRSTRSSPTRRSPRSASSARPRSPSTSTPPAPRTASACRRWAAPRTTWW